MGDEQWREAERRWRTQPSDETLAAAIQAGRRHGARIPGAMLLAQRFPRRTFSCAEEGWVTAEVEGGIKPIGYTPRPEPLVIPRHRTWWFQPVEGGARTPSFAQLVKLAGREQIPGLGVFLPRVSDRELARVADAPHVTGLALHERYSSTLRRVTDVVLASVARHRALQRLRITSSHTPPGDHVPLLSLAPLQELPELVDLAAHYPGLAPDPGIPRHARRLALSGLAPPWDPMRYLDPALDRLGTLDELVDLELQHTDATDEGLRGFLAGAAQRLERLSLEGSVAVTGHAFAELVAPRLTSLDLHATGVTDGALAHLAEATPALERLRLATCKAVGDAGLGHVAKLGTLRELDLDHCTGVTSKGLVKLAALKGLERLYLRGSPGTLATWGKGRDTLRKALPDCRIY